ncbi:hypothetical protein OA385_05010, partial [Paracoccaceae bacterium]|nr:hypothetical protein [Paracoccaceae bacterium]
IKLIEDKDIKGMEEWLKETKRLLDEDEFSILNIKLLYEDENGIVHQGKYDVEGNQRTKVSITHLREGRPWRQLVNRLAVG